MVGCDSGGSNREGDDDLSLKILSDGDVIAEGTEPNGNNFWGAEYGFIPDSEVRALPDVSGVEPLWPSE
jgi:hypothetical protein